MTPPESGAPDVTYVRLSALAGTIYRAQVGRVVVGGILKFRDGTCEWYTRAPAPSGGGHATDLDAARAALETHLQAHEPSAPAGTGPRPT